ncbi:MAG: CbiX/SirB N-terminal domain-containing protein [Roseiflexaceae bacterium]|nr:CbiX/SirB N-terminal domain-containing protein [Roseiflexaceae bacterium]
MRAVLLIGYGSVLPGIGTAMIRIASRISAAGIAPIAAAGFIDGCRPTFREALESCIADGATDVIVQPYALVEDVPIRRDLRRLLLAACEAHPNISLRLARPLGDHPALAQIALQRAMEADYAAAHGMDGLPLMSAYEHNIRRPPAALYALRTDGQGPELIADQWQPLFQNHPTGLLLVAHGSLKPAWDWPMIAAAECTRMHSQYTVVGLGFTHHNQPDVATAIDQLAARGLHYLVIVPYMLQLTAEDTEQLTQQIADAADRHPDIKLLLTEHLNYDRRLLRAIADRVNEVVSADVRKRCVAV